MDQKQMKKAIKDIEIALKKTRFYVNSAIELVNCIGTLMAAAEAFKQCLEEDVKEIENEKENAA